MNKPAWKYHYRIDSARNSLFTLGYSDSLKAAKRRADAAHRTHGKAFVVRINRAEPGEKSGEEIYTSNARLMAAVAMHGAES